MRKLILICSCLNMKNKASEAFSLMFPGEVLPEIIKGRDRIYKFAKEMQNEHIEALSKLTSKFAYYIELDDDNKVTTEYNLLTGRRTG